MNLLIIGSSSSIANVLIENLKKKKKLKIVTLGRQKLTKKNHYYIKNYNDESIIKIFKKIDKKKFKFDSIIFFNGYQKFSTLSFFDGKLFSKIIKINFIIPLKILSILLRKNLVNLNSSTLFVSSIAADLNEVGNAYYSLAKSILNKSIKILNKEQKNKHRFNILSLGMVNNKMSQKMIKNFPGKFKNINAFIDSKKMIKNFKKIIFNKNLNNSIIKIHGKYKN